MPLSQAIESPDARQDLAHPAPFADGDRLEAADSPDAGLDPFRWDRSQATDLLDQALHQDEPTSLRAFAAEHDIPPSTLHYWKQRRDRLDTSDPLREFFESPAGLEFLHGLVLAAHLVLKQTGLVGIRPLSVFFEYSRLKPFLACSYGAHQHLASVLEDLLGQYGTEQREQLGPTMADRRISLAEDENFHQGVPCLVAIEPVSNFILVEECSEKRDAAAWDGAVERATDALHVKIVQVACDEAPGLLAHARDGLGAHHSPDLMHLQQDLHRATSLPLQGHAKAAQEEEKQAEDRALQACLDHAVWDNGPPRPDPRPDFEARVAAEKEQLCLAQQETVVRQQRQEQVSEAIRGLGDDYHPIDATSGETLTPETLEEKLQGRLTVVEEAAKQAGVGETGRKKIRRVVKLLPQLVATLAWFWVQVREISQAGGWTAEQQALLQGPVLAWVYWQQASGRGRDADHREQLRELAQTCQQRVESNGVWQALSEEQRTQMIAAARESAGRWVRSSSCVEGRNGYLSLQHHGRRGLTTTGLAALTVLHNYWIRRPDGTTAAQRFFGQEPEDLFSWLLQRFPQPPRPARSRKEAA